MSPTKIYESLATARSRSFLTRTSDGEVVNVPHTNYIILSKDGEQAALFADGNSLKLIDTAPITSIEIIGSREEQSNLKS